jgi:hypothetical protein
MPEASWLQATSPAFRLMIATSWLAPSSWVDQQESAIREAVGAGPDWMEFLRLVDRHRTPALSWAALKRVAGLEIPDEIRQQLQKRSDACRMQAVKHSMLLAGVLKAFNRAGIPVMTQKGLLLSLDLYGDFGLRQSHDLDLVVTVENLPRAQACLESMGWRPESTWFPLTPRQWESCQQHEHNIGFVNPHGGSLLELHWRNQWDVPGLTSARWARSTPSIWAGCTHQSMNPLDRTLDLSSHGAEHTWSRAKWLGDLARIHAAGGLDWVAVLGEAQRSGQERALLACLRLLKDVYGLPLPALPGNPWKDLPPFLVDRSLHAIKLPEEPTLAGVLTALPERYRITRYKRLLLPHRTWRESLAELGYSREDYQVLCLPDGLFWAYAPLRPIFWVWRRVLRGKLLVEWLKERYLSPGSPPSL